MEKDKSVLVLGVGPEEGLGVALCKAFAADGYSVFGCGRSEKNMNALNKIKTDEGKITGLIGDVTKEEDVLKIAIQSDAGELDDPNITHIEDDDTTNPLMQLYTSGVSTGNIMKLLLRISVAIT